MAIASILIGALNSKAATVLVLSTTHVINQKPLADLALQLRQFRFALCHQTTTVCGESLGSFDKASLFANLIYDIMPESKFHPFVGLGVGVNRVTANYGGKLNTHNVVVSVKDKRNPLALQFIGGFAWALSDQLDLDLTYRYVDTQALTLNSAATSTGTALTSALVSK